MANTAAKYKPILTEACNHIHDIHQVINRGLMLAEIENEPNRSSRIQALRNLQDRVAAIEREELAELQEAFEE